MCGNKSTVWEATRGAWYKVVSIATYPTKGHGGGGWSLGFRQVTP